MAACETAAVAVHLSSVPQSSLTTTSRTDGNREKDEDHQKRRGVRVRAPGRHTTRTPLVCNSICGFGHKVRLLSSAELCEPVAFALGLAPARFSN